MMNVLLLAVVSLPLVAASPDPGTAPHLALGVPAPAATSCQVVYPVAVDDYVTTAKNTPVTFSPLMGDTDTWENDLVGFSQPLHGTAELVGIDAVKYTPATNYVGSDTIHYTLYGCVQCFEGWCSEPAYDYGVVHITVTN
ncbi:MAG TPA: Ig-like domain-containing protein [Thermoanaerobaculia bacterium]|nr:Ig-like domain-containing protein [Thermoanaerobaculia bacterium]